MADSVRAGCCRLREAYRMNTFDSKMQSLKSAESFFDSAAQSKCNLCQQNVEALKLLAVCVMSSLNGGAMCWM